MMSILKIVAYPERILRKKAKLIENINGNLQSLIDDMLETMYMAPGAGLAAPQIGVASRLIVGDPRVNNDYEQQFVLINPEIIDQRGEEIYEEGCLSLPGISSEVPRAYKVTVIGFDRHGKEITLEAEGYLARILQHEVDHIEGLLFWDRLSQAKRESLKRRLRKISVMEEDS